MKISYTEIINASATMPEDSLSLKLIENIDEGNKNQMIWKWYIC